MKDKDKSKGKELQIFSNPEFGELRTIEEGDKIYFVASDAAKMLGYAKPSNAISTHCKGALKRGILTGGGVQQMNVISEGDLYRLIVHSELPSAEKFESWVFDEVLPAIRKHGGYMTPEKVEEALLNPDVLIKLATELKEERNKNKALHDLTVEQDKHIARQNDRIATLEPKGIFADSVSASDTTILIGELAKIIKQNGMDIGQNRLFQWMRDQKYLIGRKGTDYNMPTQKAMKLGLFTIKETTINHSDGHVSISKTPKVTGKGQIYFVNKFLRKALN